MNKLIEKVQISFLLIRIPVGLIFLSEGIQKFLFPNELGVGRFIKIGIPYPDIMAPFVGIVEIICGTLILIENGFWNMAHEARTDFAMLFCLLFILTNSLSTLSKKQKSRGNT